MTVAPAHERGHRRATTAMVGTIRERGIDG